MTASWLRSSRASVGLKTQIKTGIIMRRQGGVALVVFLIVVVLAGISLFMGSISPMQLQMSRDLDQELMLKRAKQALLDIALDYPSYSAAVRGPGYLICPDTDNDGEADPPPCGTVGRLPYASMGTGEFRDAANEVPWYAVATNFDFSLVGGQYKINSTTRGQLTLQDSTGLFISSGTAWNAIAAVIIAPGAPLVREDGFVQERVVGASDLNDPRNYLDNTAAEDNTDFVSDTLNGFVEGDVFDAGQLIVNDQIITITYEEVMDRVHERVAREISALLVEYRNQCGVFPDAAIFDPTQPSFDSVGGVSAGSLPIDNALPFNWGDACPAMGGVAPVWPAELAWIQNEGWHAMTWYEKCGAAGANCINVDATQASVVLMFAERELPGQARAGNTSTNVADYFEGINNVNNSNYTVTQTEDYIHIVQ